LLREEKIYEKERRENRREREKRKYTRKREEKIERYYDSAAFAVHKKLSILNNCDCCHNEIVTKYCIADAFRLLTQISRPTATSLQPS